MTHDEFRRIESKVAVSHADMATRLGVSEVSVKRFATGAKPIPKHVARLSVALMLIASADLQDGYERLIAKYQCDVC